MEYGCGLHGPTGFKLSINLPVGLDSILEPWNAIDIFNKTTCSQHWKQGELDLLQTSTRIPTITIITLSAV